MRQANRITIAPPAAMPAITGVVINPVLSSDELEDRGVSPPSSIFVSNVDVNVQFSSGSEQLINIVGDDDGILVGTTDGINAEGDTVCPGSVGALDTKVVGGDDFTGDDVIGVSVGWFDGKVDVG